MERISCVMELKKDDFHYNIYNELKELNKDRVYNEPQYSDHLEKIEDFINEYLELVKDDSNEKFKKYNVHNRDYPNRSDKCIKCRLCILKKEVLGIEKDTCVFISEINKLLILKKNLKYFNQIIIINQHYLYFSIFCQFSLFHIPLQIDSKHL